MIVDLLLKVVVIFVAHWLNRRRQVPPWERVKPRQAKNGKATVRR